MIETELAHPTSVVQDFLNFSESPLGQGFLAGQDGTKLLIDYGNYLNYQAFDASMRNQRFGSLDRKVELVQAILDRKITLDVDVPPGSAEEAHLRRLHEMGTGDYMMPLPGFNDEEAWMIVAVQIPGLQDKVRAGELTPGQASDELKLFETRLFGIQDEQLRQMVRATQNSSEDEMDRIVTTHMVKWGEAFGASNKSLDLIKRLANDPKSFF